MYLHGRSYRYHPTSGKKVHLGRDLVEALRRYYLITNAPPESIDDDTALNLWNRHRKGAKQRGIQFDLSVDAIQSLLDEQGGVCAITGLHFKADKPEGLRIRPWAASLDRIDGRLGYVLGNVRVVCGFANIAMNGFGEQFFALVLNPLIDAGIKADKWISEHKE